MQKKIKRATLKTGRPLQSNLGKATHLKPSIFFRPFFLKKKKKFGVPACPGRQDPCARMFKPLSAGPFFFFSFTNS